MNKGKKYLFFDTETTGLPKSYDCTTSEVKNWPRAVQVSWLLTNDFGRTLKKGNYIVKPDGFEIPWSATKIHGITTEEALAKGEIIEVILCRFMKDLFAADCIVAHNLEFDKHIIGAEMIRTCGKDLFLCEGKEEHCTMLESTNFCALENYSDYFDDEYKWPKLIELHKILFGKGFTGTHNSLADVRATMKCFFELRKRGVM